MCCFFGKNEYDHHMQDSFIASLQICGLENIELQHTVLGNQICCVGNCHRTNTTNLTRYLWKTTCCLPLNWVQVQPDTNNSSHILHTGQRTVKLLAERTEENLSEKHVGLLCEVNVTVQSNQNSDIKPLNHLHFCSSTRKFSSETSCLFWGRTVDDAADPPFLFPKAVSHGGQKITAQQYDIRFCDN